MKKYYVVFTKSECQDLIFKVIDRKLSHCFIAEEVPVLDQKILVVTENRLEKLDTGVVFNEIGNLIRSLPNASAVIELEWEADETRSSMLLEPFSCVSCTKRVLSIFNRRIQTPKQLYDYLLSNGGKIWAEEAHQIRANKTHY